jgi:hypothetical protein
MYWLRLASRRSPDALFNSKDLEVIRRGDAFVVNALLSVQSRQSRVWPHEKVDRREVDTIAAGIEFCWCGVESLKANP